jgi:hypothetical protein
MADFRQSSQSKNAVRDLAVPISDVATFESIVQSVIATNPFGCVDYMSGGVNHPGVEKTREHYTTRFTYENPATGNRGNGVHQFDTVEGYTAGIAALNSGGLLATAHGGNPLHVQKNDAFVTTLKCRDPNGEFYNVVFNRKRVAVQSYSDEAILVKVETWADTMAPLA